MVNITQLHKVRMIANEVRKVLETKYGKNNLHGKCIEASDMIIAKMNSQGLKGRIIEGWIKFDIEEYGSDRPYDEHTWVEWVNNPNNQFENNYIIDVTLDQFQDALYDDISAIIIMMKDKILECYSLEEPKLDEDGYLLY